jgi:lysophospholipase L1-like esterase
MQWVVFGVCFLTTLELSSRIEQWVNYGAPFLGMYTYDSALFARDEFGIRGKAHGAYEKWRLNSFGFRGPEIRVAKDEHRLRVICLGASETFGLYETLGKEWPRQLEEQLRGSGVDAEVINAALPGMSLPQRIIHLEKRLLPLSPDVVIFMIEYSSYAGLTPERLKNFRVKRNIPPKEIGLVDVLTSFRVSRQLKDLTLPRLPIPVQDTIAGIKLANKKRDLGVKFRSLTQVTSFEIDTFEEDLRVLAARANSSGVKVVLVLPAMWLTERTMATTYLSYPYIDETWWREAKGVFSLLAKRFADERGIPFLDLSVVIDGREATYMNDMVHFNDRGAKEAAQNIARTLLNHRLGYVTQHGSQDVSGEGLATETGE